MNKKELEEIIKRLKEYENSFDLAYPDYKNGRNKTIRDKAERDVSSVISQAKRYIYENDVFGIAGETEKSNGQIFREDEFFQWHYFSRDVAGLIKKLEEIKENGDFE